MFNDKISDYVEGVAAKYLRAVDADSSTSNQHEIGGLIKAGFEKYLGKGRENFRYRVRQIYVGDNDEDPTICDGNVTWYDARRDDPKRDPEYRLYYYDSPVTELMCEGDFFLIAKLKHELPNVALDPQVDAGDFHPGSFLMVIAPAGSNAEFQLRTIFGLDNVGDRLKAGLLDAVALLLPIRSMLEDIGIELSAGLSQEDSWLEALIDKFGGTSFPKTAVFSSFARKTLEKEVSPFEAPDETLMAWMNREESLFKIYEKHIVKERLATGFGEDVEAFIDFSLSVQNRRKSRAGHAFEGHLDCLFQHHGLQFEQGRGKGKVTENNSKPDFIFPSFKAYHDASFPIARLKMLGAKTTCKDRWRQVLSEAKRIEAKHLVTLEAAISRVQFDEMKSNRLQLVVPSAIHPTYLPEQQEALMNIEQFISCIKDGQRAT